MPTLPTSMIVTMEFFLDNIFIIITHVAASRFARSAVIIAVSSIKLVGFITINAPI